MSLEFRPPTEADWPAFTAVMEETFMEAFGPGAADTMRLVMEPPRVVAGFAGDQVEATAGAYRQQLQVPGGVVPCTGITWITVSARHRRQGALREIMRRLLEVGAAAGEPVAALYAAEGSIYNRFGFGVAARMLQVRVDSRELAELPPSPGRVVEVSRDDALARFPAIFEATTAGRPGIQRRTATWWTRVLRHDEFEEPGWMPPRRLVYVDAGGKDRGCATIRLKAGYRHTMHDGRCRLTQLFAADAEAARAIWRYAGSIDLVTRVTAPMRPLDEPLPFMVPDLRQVRLRADEELWVHLAEPVAALTARRYGAEGRLRIRVDDPSWPAGAGTFELEVAGNEARCARVDGDADLELGAPALGSMYLGTIGATQLAAAGQVIERTPGAVATAQRLFAAAPAAWSPDVW